MEHAKKSICSAVYKLFATFGRISNPTSPKDTWRKNLAQYYLCNSWWFSSELVRCEAFLFLADFAKGRGQKASACPEPQIFNLGPSAVALGGRKCHHQQFGANNRGKFLLWQCQTPQHHWDEHSPYTAPNRIFKGVCKHGSPSVSLGTCF